VQLARHAHAIAWRLAPRLQSRRDRESPAEAHAIDERIAALWARHPRRFECRAPAEVASRIACAATARGRRGCAITPGNHGVALAR
jgi:hypothetical protein